MLQDPTRGVLRIQRDPTFISLYFGPSYIATTSAAWRLHADGEWEGEKDDAGEAEVDCSPIEEGHVTCTIHGTHGYRWSRAEGWLGGWLGGCL